MSRDVTLKWKCWLIVLMSLRLLLKREGRAADRDRADRLCEDIEVAEKEVEGIMEEGS